MQDIEVNHNKFIGFQQKFNDFSAKFTAALQHLEELSPLPKFLESITPLMIHF